MVRNPGWASLGVVLALAAGGCSTAPSSPDHAVSQGPAAAAPARTTQAESGEAMAQLAAVLPERLTNEEAKAQLVNLPADKLKGTLNFDPAHRQTQLIAGLGGVGYYPHGSYYYPYMNYGSYWYPYTTYAAPTSSYYYPYYYGLGGYYYPYSTYYPYSYFPYSYTFGLGGVGGFGFMGRRGFGGRGFGGRGFGGRGFGGGGRGGRR